MPTASLTDLARIRDALTTSATLRGYFSDPVPKHFDGAWHPDGVDEARRLNDVLWRAGLVVKDRGLFLPCYRINTVDADARPLFVVTDQVSNRAPDRVFPWADEAASLVKFLVPKLENAGDDRLRVADVCTGAGTIALQLASRYPWIELCGVDNNAAAISLARFNAKLNGLGDVAFRRGDLVEPLADEEWDWAVVNPPVALEPPGVREFEHSYGGPVGQLVTSDFLRSLGSSPRFERVFILAYALGDSVEPTGLFALRDLVAEHYSWYWHGDLGDDALVWRIGEQKRFRSPMAVRYTITRVFDSSRLEGEPEDLDRELDAYAAWHDRLHLHGDGRVPYTHLHYGILELTRKSDSRDPIDIAED